MRVLLLLRGAAGCGKSTWIQQNGLEQFALSADEIRMLHASPQMQKDGSFSISQANDAVVWATLFKILEVRMQHGEFTVIDATNSKTSEMNRYKEMCNQYRYRMYCVDFTDIPIEVVKRRNLQRPELKQVPETAIDKMYARFATQKIPSGITVIKPDELDRVWLKKLDMNRWNKIHIIGDIHGCNTVFQEYLASEGGIRDDEFYIFLGDYIDRGIENVEFIRWMLSVYGRENILFLEGNHERWLWIWANGGVAGSKEFELLTKTQLENEEVDRKEIRKLYRRFGQCAYFTYRGNTYLVTHGGLSALPRHLTFVPTDQMIKGVGNYHDYEDVENSFLANTAKDTYQIHGHRNTKGLPLVANDRNFNLEGRVEFGGQLRVVQLLNDGSRRGVECTNTVFRPADPVVNEEVKTQQQTIGDMIISLRQNKYVQEKKFGNISSFNFTKQAFYDRVWDSQTTKARGLYINVPQQRVVARAYDKFFNINERPETKLEMLQNIFCFPVTAYVKENGFLGIVSYNDETDELFVTTKSSLDGDYAQWFRGNLETQIGFETLEKIKTYSKEHNVSFVFECVDMVHDPHVVEYPENRLYLLDIVYNEIPFRKMEFDAMCSVAEEFGLHHKELARVLESWSDFYDWYWGVLDEDYLYNGRVIEGFVLEDANGFMTKLKLAYYNFWKFMRDVAHETLKRGYIAPKRTSALTTPLANQFYGFCKTLYEKEERDSLPLDICALRKMFLQSEAGKAFVLE